MNGCQDGRLLVVELMLGIVHELVLLLMIKRAFRIPVYVNLDLVAVINRRWEFN